MLALWFLLAYLYRREILFSLTSMRTIRLLIVFCSISFHSFSQAWVWDKPISTSSNNIATDPNENIILLSANVYGTVLSKYSKDGLPLWSKQFTKATGYTPSGTLVTDKNGNIYTFTQGFDSIDHQFVGINPVGISKFGPNGNFLWHVNYSARANVFPIQIDDSNNVYVGYSASFPYTQITLGSTTITVNPPSISSPFVSFGSLSPNGTVRWLRGFITNSLFISGTIQFTGVSICGNQLFFCGSSAQYSLILDFGTLSNSRCSAWFASINCNTGVATWGKTHPLFLYCLGTVCFCYTPSIDANTSNGRIALTNKLNGAFEFRPNDTIASITAFGQTTVKPYYTIYDTNGAPIKGKIIDPATSGYPGADHLIGSRGNFTFIMNGTTLIKVDTGFNHIWTVALPPGVEKVFIPKNTKDIIATYSDANGGVHLAKMTDSAAVISGRIYADWNNDGAYTSSADSALSNILISSNMPLTNSISGNDSGKYYMNVSTGSYSLNAHFFNHPYYQFLPVSHPVTIAQLTDTITGKDFRLRPLFSFTDVSVKFSSLNNARPGRVSYYNVTVKNYGATTVPVEVGLKLPPLTAYNSISGAAVTVNAPDSITITMGNVNPFQTKRATLNLDISTTATLTDTLKYYPKAYPYVTDTIKVNNIDTLNQNVRTSFDPNEKEVNLKGQPDTDTDKPLQYTVHFQNTGTDTAFYVRIADTLSSKLDMRTFSFIDASHTVTTEIHGNIINFIFNPVALPDSNHNEPQSHGFVKFSIKPIVPFTITDTIYNNAAIYFDYNSPVITNSTKSWYYTNAPLPVILQSFVAEKKNSAVLLNFVTASEPGLDRFIIERSEDGLTYKQVGTITAKGSMSGGNTYLFEDLTPAKGVNFYRLKMIDKDGKISYSWVLIIRNDDKIAPQITVFPNPANDNLYIQFRDVSGASLSSCMISDATGKTVWAANINTSLRNTYVVNTSALPSGIYFIKVSNTVQSFHYKFAVKH